MSGATVLWGQIVWGGGVCQERTCPTGYWPGKQYPDAHHVTVLHDRE